MARVTAPALVTRRQYMKDTAHKHHRRALHPLILITGLHILNHASKIYFPRPYHTSKLTGLAWIKELLAGHPDRIKDNLGVGKTIFKKLVSELVIRGELRARQYLDCTEQLGIFLYQAVTTLSIRKVAERFQRSNETISRHDIIHLMDNYWLGLTHLTGHFIRSFRPF